MNLDVGGFERFFREIYGCEPYPWQRTLVERLLAGEGWPGMLVLPTGAGKTAVLDIAVYHLAAEHNHPTANRCAPLRIFYVVDRRLIVDQAYDRACHLARALSDAPSGATKKVAEALRRFIESFDSGTAPPLWVSRLRGGIYRETLWTPSPTHPTVCVSTVDQLGSRLLFRGYGLSAQMRPVHAGLVGHDVLFILDEAHLSQPFVETLYWIRHYRGNQWAERPIRTPFEVVQMSATARREAASLGNQVATARLSEADRQHDELGRRLRAMKCARLVKLDDRSSCGSTSDDPLVGEAVQHAQRMAAQTSLPDPWVAIVVNRVRTARLIFEELSRALAPKSLPTGLAEIHEPAPCPPPSGAEVLLLTGRVREYDRQILSNRIATLERARGQAGSRAVFVVATQTIEVGADLDFDAMVTEIAPLDALRQRFGRLNRRGRREQAEAVILARRTQLEKNFQDVVYGTCLKPAWDHLNAHADRKSRGVSVGPEARVWNDAPPESLSPAASAPVLLPTYLDTWAHTNPSLEPDFEVGIFLHGPRSAPPDVQIVWRADLPTRTRNGVPVLDASREAEAIEALSALPPTSLEALSIPVWAARDWLCGEGRAGEVSDVEGSGRQEPGDGRPEERLVIRWQGPRHSTLIGPREIRPGDTLVAPSVYGGVDRFGWMPQSREPVIDLAELCNWIVRRRAVLRLCPNVAASWVQQADDSTEIPSLSGWLATALAELEKASGADAEMQAISGVLEELCQRPQLRSEIIEVTEALIAASHRVRIIKHPLYRPGYILQAPVARSVRTAPAIPLPLEDQEDEASSFEMPGRLTLQRHTRDVVSAIETIVRSTAVTTDLARDLVRAAELHDLGKADPRFQAWLLGGDRFEAEIRTATEDWAELLAKSEADSGLLRAQRRARAAAGYPDRARHEVLSVVLASSSKDLSVSCGDLDLVLWLVGTHHGHGRPFFEAVDDTQPPSLRLRTGGYTFEAGGDASRGHAALVPLEAGWADRFWRLLRRYGWWGLAYLEALLRAADMLASQRERQSAPSQDDSIRHEVTL